MALTFTAVPDGENVEGKFRTRMFDVALDNSYVTGGYAITGSERRAAPRRQGFRGRHQGHAGQLWRRGPQLRPDQRQADGLLPNWRSTASPAALAAPKSTSGGATASAVDATTPNITPGQGKEVANATDLSTITLRMKFVEI
jgi:hypothetical protein